MRGGIKIIDFNKKSFTDVKSESLADYLDECKEDSILINNVYVAGNKFSHVFAWRDGEWVLLGTHVKFILKEDEKNGGKRRHLQKGVY